MRTSSKSGLLFTALLSILASSATACSGFTSSDTPSDESTKGGAAPGSTPGTSTDPNAPPAPAPLVGTPKENELTEQFGVFVVPSGAADAPGTRQQPFGSIATAIVRAKAAQKRVYVCEGTFKEAVTIEDGVAMVGGFDCSQFMWKKTDHHTRIDSPSSPALRATEIKSATRFEGFDVYAPDGTTESPTSIGLHATNASMLTISASKIIAGRGHDGAAGTEGVQLANEATAVGTQSKNDDMITSTDYDYLRYEVGAGGTNTCVGAASPIVAGSGQRGGAGGAYDCTYQNNGMFMWSTRSAPEVMPLVRGVAGVDGVAGSSASGLGSLTANGFVPSDGSVGTNGAAGLGGSGGSSIGMALPICSGGWGYSAPGGGGGAGGCPGLAGTAGKGGGASVGALVASSSGVVFDATEIVSSDGGNGGKGTFGSSATAGGAPAAVRGMGVQGQAGGAGGRAGVSGSGAGGPSFAIAHTGGEPKLEGGSTTKSGKGGWGVAEATKTDAGATKTIPASAHGIEKDVYGF